MPCGPGKTKIKSYRVKGFCRKARSKKGGGGGRPKRVMKRYKVTKADMMAPW